MASVTTSSQYAGYKVDEPAGSISDVYANWVVPTLTTQGTGPNTGSAVLIGFDGLTSSLGTIQKIESGTPTYYCSLSWPTSNGFQKITSMSISPGDHIFAKIDYYSNAGELEFVIDDESQSNDSFDEHYSGANSQGQQESLAEADWFVLPVGSTGSAFALANFGSVTITNAVAIIDGNIDAIDQTGNSTQYQLDNAAGTITTGSLADGNTSADSIFTTPVNSSTFTVSDSPSLALTASTGTLNGAIHLSWPSVGESEGFAEDATAYVLERTDLDSGDVEASFALSSAQLDYTDKDIAPGEVYVYTLRCMLNGSDSGQTDGAEFDLSADGYSQGYTVSQGDANGVEITWQPVTAAKGYAGDAVDYSVVRTSQDGTVDTLTGPIGATASQSSYTYFDITGAPGEIYNYDLQYTWNNGAVVSTRALGSESGYSQGFSVSQDLPGAVDISWAPITASQGYGGDATGYALTRTDSSGNTVNLESFAQGQYSYTDTSTSAGKKYSYNLIYYWMSDGTVLSRSLGSEGGFSASSALSPTIGTGPAQIKFIAGKRLKGKEAVSVQNVGTGTVEGLFTVNLYAVSAGESATSGILVGSARHGTLAGDRAVILSVPFKAISLPSGNYTLIPVVTDSAGGTATAVGGPTLAVAAPYSSLSATLSATATSVSAGGTLKLTLTLTNSGNAISSGPATINLYLSADGVALSIPLTSVMRSSVKVTPTKPYMLKMTVMVPATSSGTQVYPIAVVAQGLATPVTAASSIIDVI